MAIMLKDIFGIDEKDFRKYNVHFAIYALDVFLSDRKSWIEDWNSNKGHKDSVRKAFSCDYIITFIDIGDWNWLFGGIIRRTDDNGNEAPVVSDMYKDMIGRLIVKYHKKDRTTYRYLGTSKEMWDKLEVKEILDMPIESKQFVDYNNVHLSFSELKRIVEITARIWKEKLESVQGIYLVFDKKTEKMYIGKADGQTGIWGRWVSYANSNGTGDNDKLVKLIEKNGIEYAENFEFTLLEYYFKGQIKDKKFFDGRESYWKQVFHSRAESIGLNSN